MGPRSVLRLICLALPLLSVEAAPPRNRRRAHHDRTNSVEYNINAPKSHQVLLNGAQCTVPQPPEIKAPKLNIWDNLHRGAGDDIKKWLIKEAPELNLTRATYAERKNYVSDVELMQPNKSYVLDYLDNNGPKPDAYASVRLYFGAGEKPPEYSYVLVGPLPISNATTWQPLTYPFTNKNPVVDDYPTFNYRDYDKFIRPYNQAGQIIMKDLFNLTKHDYYDGGGTSFVEDGKIIVWDEYWGNSVQSTFDTYDLLPLGVFYGSALDLATQEWSFLGWLYNGIIYPTAEEFENAFDSSGFKVFPPGRDGHWAWTDQKGPVLGLDDEAPPTPVAKTARFSIDWSQKYVEWMGWSFYIAFKEDSGATFHDVRFKGERIIFEMALQEALALYAGADPYQSTTAYYDAQYGLGSGNELMPGYDCPTYASYLNITFEGEYSFRDVNAVCLFEFDADYPIQRHAYTSNTKNIFFVIRTVTTVGNYDYMFSYEFYMDGSIQIVVRAAGYIQAAAYSAANHDYGYQIHNGLSGSMHDHIFNYKIDFDILGTSNTMELVTVTPTTETYPWSNYPRNTMKLVRHQVESEDESRLMWAANGATQYRIVNTDEPNEFGEYRGYRVLPSQGAVHLAATNSTNILNAANWAYHDLQITQRKDTEPKSMDYLNTYNEADPAINFDDFFDSENLLQEDLVMWVNLGVHHIPHTGDLPNTVFTTAHTAIQIAPSNYFKYDQSRDTVNMIRIAYNRSTETTNVLTFGAAPQICVSNLTGLGYGGYY